MDSLNRFLSSKQFWLLFAAMVVFVYFFGLTVPLLGPDEPRYAQVAREMFERGDWVTTTLGGHNWFEKPALLYWLQIVSFKLFGISEFAARFGSAVFGLGTITALWFYGKVGGVSENNNANEQFANYVALIAATSLGLIVFSRGASFDIILTFPITAALVGFYAFDRAANDKTRRLTGLFCFYFFTGLALLAKGLVGIVFPFAIVAFYHVLTRRFPSRRLILSGFWGLPVTAVVAAMWYVPMYLANGWEFIEEFFIQHHFQRYTSNKYLHPQPFHFFFWVLPPMVFPWIPFFFGEVYRSIRNFAGRFTDRTAPKGADEQEHAALMFAFAWLAVPLVFFSFSGSKLPGYILPAVPGAIIITALSAYRWAQISSVRASIVRSLAVITLIVVSAIIQFALPRFADADSVKTLIDAANDAGYENEKVIGFVTVSHNAEWYAAGRLFRDNEGRQKRLNNPGEINTAMTEAGSDSLLVIVRTDLIYHITNEPSFETRRIADNGEYAIVAVSRKK